MNPTEAPKNLRAAKFKLALILVGILLVPVALTLLFNLDDVQQYGSTYLWGVLVSVGLPTYTFGVTLYRLARLPASPARHTLDLLLVAFLIIASGATLDAALHPHADTRNSGFFTDTLLFVALCLCGRFWPLDALLSPRPGIVRLLLRWADWIGRLLVVVVPIPMAIWLMRIDWLHAAARSPEETAPFLMLFALFSATFVGLRADERYPARSPRQLSEQALAESVASTPLDSAGLGQATGDATGERGVLLTRSAALRREGMSGELWLFDGGLLRIPLGWLKTLTYVNQLYDARHPNLKSFESGEFARATTNPRNLWIPREVIAAATLKHILGYDELRLTLTDGESRRLLWAPWPATYQRLSVTLGEWLGERLEAY